MHIHEPRQQLDHMLRQTRMNLVAFSQMADTKAKSKSKTPVEGDALVHQGQRLGLERATRHDQHFRYCHA